MLAATPLGERLHSDLFDQLAGGAQLPAGVRGAALTAQPLPVQQVGTGELGSHAAAAQPVEPAVPGARGGLDELRQRPHRKDIELPVLASLPGRR